MQFLGPGGVLSCYVHELYDGQRMRPEKLAAWRALRERYGNRDKSRVDRGTLFQIAIISCARACGDAMRVTADLHA